MAKQQRDSAKEDFWREALQRHGASGLSVREFCRRERLAESAFYAWRRTIGLLDGAGGLPPAVVTKEAPGEGSLAIELAGGCVVSGLRSGDRKTPRLHFRRFDRRLRDYAITRQLLAQLATHRARKWCRLWCRALGKGAHIGAVRFAAERYELHRFATKTPLVRGGHTGARNAKSPAENGAFGSKSPRIIAFLMRVPEEGLEPSRPCGHWILNPAENSHKDQQHQPIRASQSGAVPTVVPRPIGAIWAVILRVIRIPLGYKISRRRVFDTEVDVDF